MLEGGIFLSAGLAPGIADVVRQAFIQHPELLSAARLEELLAAFALLQRIAMAFGLLCICGGWGAMQGTRWGKRVAIVASVLNLPLIPLFTPIGIAGLIVFSRTETTGQPATESDKQPAAIAERPEPVSHVLVIVASLALVVYFSHLIRQFAVAQGLPANVSGRLGLQWIIAGQLVFTLLHELGHLLAAWATGFQFHQINVGPVTLTERPGGSWALRFQLDGLLTAGGYLRAVPQSEQDLRMNWIFVVVAGPAASLLLAMLGFLALVSLPGTPAAGYWDWAAYVASICLADCVSNLLPLGLTDGALLFHTVFETNRGKAVLAGLEAAMLNDRAERQGGLMDPAELLETRRQALEQLEKSPEVPGLDVAIQRIEFARASMRNGRAEEAANALQEAGRSLQSMTGVPDVVWFRYWVETFESATARRHYSSAAEARKRALALGEGLRGENMDWEDLVPIRVSCARLLMSDGELHQAIVIIQQTREKCPARRSVTAHAAELLAAEAECEIRLGHPEHADMLAQNAIEIARELPDPQRTMAMELLAHAAVRMGTAGDCAFAQPLFAAAVEGLDRSASPSIAAGYRSAWAESLYENGKLEESAAVLRQIDSASIGFALDVETLRAQLLLAEDKPADAVSVLSSMLAGAEEDCEETTRVALARSRALRSWALFRSGSIDDAIADARKACDLLMPVDHPEAAPALLTLAMSVIHENPELSDAYVQEGARLICDSTLYAPLTKASRLTDMARSVLQANKKDWARDLLGQAAKFRDQSAHPAPVASLSPAVQS